MKKQMKTVLFVVMLLATTTTIFAYAKKPTNPDLTELLTNILNEVLGVKSDLSTHDTEIKNAIAPLALASEMQDAIMYFDDRVEGLEDRLVNVQSDVLILKAEIGTLNAVKATVTEIQDEVSDLRERVEGTPVMVSEYGSLVKVSETTYVLGMLFPSMANIQVTVSGMMHDNDIICVWGIIGNERMIMESMVKRPGIYDYTETWSFNAKSIDIQVKPDSGYDVYITYAVTATYVPPE